MPPMAGLQLIWAIVCIFMVTSRTLEPKLAALAAASHPACPAPTTIMSYSGNIGRQRYFRKRENGKWNISDTIIVSRGTSVEFSGKESRGAVLGHFFLGSK